MKALFRYCGNKGRLLKYYRKPPEGTKRIVELYLGGGSFSLNHDFPALGIDQDPKVTELWKWLKTATEEDLLSLDREISEIRSLDPRVDVRTLGLPPGPSLYIKVNICGLVVGQWSSQSLYPQHRLPLEKTIQALEQARRTEILEGDASLYLDLEEEGDLVFIDPPYTGTSANYHLEGKYDPQSTIDLLPWIRSPIIFTYGDGADHIFPGLPWEKVVERKVPNFRNGGVVSRTEFVCYLNWPNSQTDTLSMFGPSCSEAHPR